MQGSPDGCMHACKARQMDLRSAEAPRVPTVLRIVSASLGLTALPSVDISCTGGLGLNRRGRRCSGLHAMVYRENSMGISVDNSHITAGHELPAAAAPRGVVAIDRLPFVLNVGLPLEQQSYEM